MMQKQPLIEESSMGWAKGMDMGLVLMKMDLLTKDNGNIILKMYQERSIIKIELSLKAFG